MRTRTTVPHIQQSKLITCSRCVPRPCRQAGWCRGRVAADSAPAGRSALRAISVDDCFDSGNGQLFSAEDPQNILVKLRSDPYTPHDQQSFMQNFCFRVAGGIRGKPIRVSIINAGDATTPEAYATCKVYRSYSLQSAADWVLVSTSFDQDSGILTVEDTPASDVVYYAYWPPYQYARGQDFISRTASAYPDLVRHWVVGHSVQGRPLDVLVIGREPLEGKKRVWLQARSHPGEPQSGYFLEGLVQGLLDPQYQHHCSRYGAGTAEHVLDHAVLYLALNVNPDGTVLGHMRTNALGANLNREWVRPHPTYTPEVACLRDALDSLGGCSLFLDLHADWGAPHNWLFWPRWGIPSWNEELDRVTETFDRAWLEVQPAFQNTVNYQPYPAGAAPLHMADNQAAARYAVVAGTLEQPFSNCMEAPDEERGWGPARAEEFGASMLWPLRQVVAMLPEPSEPRLPDPVVKGYTIGMVGLHSETTGA